MQFNNGKSNNKDKQTNVNTRGIQFMNKEGFDPSTMVLGFWNDMISIKIHPALDANKQTETNVYDYETTFSTVLTIEKAQLLLDIIRKELYPAIENGTPLSKGISIGANSLVLLSTGMKNLGNGSTFIGIFKNLDAEMKSDSMICYEFKDIEVLNDYNPITGEFNKITEMAQVRLFEGFLESAISALTHASVHSDRHVNKYYRDTLLNAVGAKSSNNSFGGGTTTRNVFSNGGDTSTGASTTRLENDDALESFMGN